MKYIKYFESKNVKKHDKIKNEYCKNNNIRLIRIPYTSINEVNTILNRELGILI